MPINAEQAKVKGVTTLAKQLVVAVSAGGITECHIPVNISNNIYIVSVVLTQPKKRNK